MINLLPRSRWLLLILTLSLINISAGGAFPAHAQTTCGLIISDEGDEVPIADCDNPFGVGPIPDDARVSYGGAELVDGGIHEIALGASQLFSIRSVRESLPTGELYHHVGQDYHLVKRFPDFEKLDAYVDSLSDEEYQEYLYADTRALERELTMSFAFAETGTYTLVVTEDLPPVVTYGEREGLLAFIRNLWAPTAHAQSPEPAPYAITFEVREAQQKASNIMFLPGFQASRLYTERTLGVADRLWTPTIDQNDVEALALSDLGISHNEVFTKDILLSVGKLDVYAPLKQKLDLLVENEFINDWQAFPYDWRHDVHDIVQNGTRYGDGSYVHPTTTLAGLAQLSATEKVTIVAHSNGGLLAKAMLDELEKNGTAHLVDRVIFVGSPQLGAPKTVGSLLHGYGQEITIKGLYTVVPAETARYASQNMPGGYSLLPSEELMQEVDGPLVTFTNEESTGSYFDAYGETIDTAAELHAFLLGVDDGRVQPERDDLETPAVLNERMLTRAEENHSHWANWNAPEGVEVVTIVGTGIYTPESFHYRQEEVKNCTLLVFCETQKVLDYEVGMSTRGDGTVPAASAAHYGDTYYIDMQQFNADHELNADHAVMSGIEPVTTLLNHLVTGSGDLPSYVSRTAPNTDTDGIRISTHSPVVFAVTDERGRRTGIIVHEDGGREYLEEIPNSYIVETPESIYVGLYDGREVEINITGTGDGTFDLEVAHTQSGAVTSRSRQEDIPVSTTATAAAILDERGVLTTFTVDTDGDGTPDRDVLATTTEETTPTEEEIESEEANGNSGGISGGYISTRQEPEGKVLGASTTRGSLARSDIEAALVGVALLHQYGRISTELHEALTHLFELILTSDFLFKKTGNE